MQAAQLQTRPALGHGIRPSASFRRPVACALLGTLLPFLTGCRGDRILRIESVPPGATVRLDDHVIGRTPLEIEFEHYGQRRLSLYKATYRTYSEPLDLRAPWWARFPVDLVTEVLLPLRLDDVREERIILSVDAGESEATVATQEFIDHALRARGGDLLIDVPIAGETAPDGSATGPVSTTPEAAAGQDASDAPKE